MNTVVIINDERIEIVHPDGFHSTYSGKAATEKDALKDIKAIILKTNRTAAASASLDHWRKALGLDNGNKVVKNHKTLKLKKK